MSSTKRSHKSNKHTTINIAIILVAGDSSRMKKITAVVEGGKSRQESAFKGLKEAEKSGTESGDIILFQNGCNPLVSKEEILKIIKETKKQGRGLSPDASSNGI